MAFGYDWLFVLDGLTCIVAAWAFRYFLPNDKKIAQDKADILDAPMPDIPTATIKSPYRDPYFILFVVSNMFMAIAFVQFMFSLTIYFKDILLIQENWVGILLGFNGLAVAFIEMPFVHIYEQKGYKKLPAIIFGTVLIGLSYLILPITHSAGIAVACMVLLTIGEIISFPFSATYALNKAAPENRGAYMGFFGISWSVALIVSPLIAAWLINSYDYSVAWLVIGTLPILGSLGMYYLYINE